MLKFHDLAARHPGLTPAMGTMFAEAARVCLDRHHASPVQLAIDFNEVEFDVTAEWAACDANIKAAYANDIDTTEWGAYCIALAAVEHVADFVAIHRAETGTGADYYVALDASGVTDLEDAYRLEISGIDGGDRTDVRVRLRQKIQQVLKGSGNLPAMAAVVGFKALFVAADLIAAES